MPNSPHKTPISREASDVSPKTSVVLVVGAVLTIVQLVTSGDFNSPELATALTTVILTIASYVKKDSIRI